MIKEHLDAGVLHILMSLMPDTFFWKLKMLYELQNYLNSNLHDVKAQTLILKSGKDMLLPSIIEGETLGRVLPNCEIRSFVNNGNPLLLDDSFNLLSVIKTAGYYRRGAHINYVTDFLPLSPSEFQKMYEPFSWMEVALDPVMFSTTDSGKIVRELEGVPSEGPILLVGNHMILGLDAILLVSRFWNDRDIMVRGMAHPVHFKRMSNGKVVHLPPLNIASGGIVPASAYNLYRLLSLKSHVLLYPGGAREVLHRKGEEHKLIWPDEPEFVRMAARFGAKIIPFAAVGEDDACHLLLDFDDQMKIPPLKAFIEQLNNEVGRLRTDAKGEIGNQLLHYPLLVPKLPGRFYYLFGKPIATEGMKDILSDRDKACELYLQVKTQIQKSIAYLKDKREKDPYRNILPRLAYQGYHGFDIEIPTFNI
ncbi:hypothetical protein RD792_004851 [Penstemon davidsonii]|uniref:Acyltransferase n=1 Tax=Penstemon davidsonii TaxID=160366 RepID=A0ABR0DIJ8_9LAMI|nr:hypothetical protein RD792_004851 [Penstemon davidsonii]